MKEKKKLKYVTPEVKPVLIELSDVIATSGQEPTEDPSYSMPDGTWQ